MSWASIRKRFAPVLIAVGLASALFIMSARVPVDRHVAFRLGDAHSITGLEVTWERRPSRGSEDALPIRAIAWHFPEGSAPNVLDNVTPLADGDYNVDVTVERGARRDTSRRVVVVGHSNDLAIPIR
jgi:hypothetical protein